MLGQLITACPISTYTYTDEASAAALTLSLIYSVHNTLANPIQITSSLTDSL
ncbi:hypothetical protein D3C73_1612600 [compost metagenome]